MKERTTSETSVKGSPKMIDMLLKHPVTWENIRLFEEKMKKCNGTNKNNKQKGFVVTSENANPEIIEDMDRLRALISYFLGRAPNISSASSPTLDRSKHEKVFAEMFNKWETSNFIFSKRKRDTTIKMKELNLLGENLPSDEKRFVCKLGKSSETQLECFLRHIRNAIAHGGIYLDHELYETRNRINILFEDNYENSINARIICNQTNLDTWRTILRAAVKEYGDKNE